jgi:hypothetical protein
MSKNKKSKLNPYPPLQINFWNFSMDVHVFYIFIEYYALLISWSLPSNVKSSFAKQGNYYGL